MSSIAFIGLPWPKNSTGMRGEGASVEKAPESSVCDGVMKSSLRWGTVKATGNYVVKGAVNYLVNGQSANKVQRDRSQSLKPKR